MKKLIALAILVASTISCNQKQTPPTTVTIEDAYTLEIPSNLAPIQELFPGADLQYGNTYLQTYLIGKKSVKAQTSNFQAFVDQSLALYNKRPNYEIVKKEDVTINGIKGQQYELKMSQKDVYMYMIQTMLNGEKANYLLMGWTTSQNAEVESQKIKETINTFKEL
ncbi:hypothetical protein [Myroides pelagicus]|uniref:DUF1795 domain-containing protein n=1 Tax=Myroides pelagicus TaxID=270914 RepID=A0A7K1GL50_9FLAO|nr:hypothetical protein [Myroides pelagicus]MEC4113996.1 hypothetical protein [Myroides pelagicus]MTH29587.1 hypothetical protein [Myroides pelagicus]